MNQSNLKGLAILVVEDEAMLRKRIAAYLEKHGAEVTAAATVAEARNALGSSGFDAALLDVHLPDGSGTDLLRDSSFSSNTVVLVMTAEGGVGGAVEAMRLGAADYLVKPFDPEELPVRIERLRRERRRSRADEFRARQNAAASVPFFFGPSLAKVREQLDKIVAAEKRMHGTPPPVLIEGETGSGKTSLARWLHENGPRADGPMIEVNCSALPESLAESELFGHERGAFTDAREERIGLFEAADGGTLFLDELPSLPASLQAKILTVLEDGLIRRVGSSRTTRVDVCVIAATSVDLREQVKEKKFREDLLHRLDLFRVAMPPLRARGADIASLAKELLARTCRRYGLPMRTIPKGGRDRLSRHTWPGNVRELEHELERAVVFGEPDALEFANLAHEGESRLGAFDLRSPIPPEGFVLDELIDELVRKAIQQTGGNVSAAARLLSVTRDFVRYRLKQKDEE
ncbi:MAG TPA: sigma-54 dependent transcriptional regulator [Opitutaceae bacterium]|nr:sigma-54 dependent transcriptional regulator [Opitutaceae bacterium]